MSANTLVIVDDNRLARDGLCQNVRWQEHGVRVVGAFANGRDALEFIRATPPDVVITDIAMPIMDGIELANALQTLAPTVKVVLISAYSEFNYARDGLRAGVFDYIIKPFEYDALVEIVLRAIAQGREERERDVSANRSRRFRRLVGIESAEPDDSGDDMGWYVCALLRGDGDALSRFRCPDCVAESFDMPDASRVLILSLRGPEQRELAVRALRESLEATPDAFAGVSSAARGEGMLRQAYEAALEALCQGFMDNSTRLWEKSDSPATRQVRYLPDMEETYATAVALGNADRAGEQTAALRAYLEANNADARFARAMACALVLKAAQRLSIDKTRFEHMLQALQNATCGEAMFAMLEDETREMCGRAASNPTRRACVIAAEQVIRARYADESLDLKKIARAVAISPSYLSTVYKRETGENLTDTLTRVRIEHAQTLLREGARISEAAQAVGFPNPFYFSTIFKKYTGVAPSRYAVSPVGAEPPDRD